MSRNASENSNIKLPKINRNPTPKLSESYNYFKYAKDQMKNGDLNPLYIKTNPNPNIIPYHPYHAPHQMDLDPKPFKSLLEREQTVYNRINDNVQTATSYSLPGINHLKGNSIDIREGEIVNFPDESYIPLSKFSSIQELFKQKKKKDIRTIRFENRPRWKLLRYLVIMMRLFYSLRKLTKSSLNLKENQFVNIQAIKANLMELRQIIIPSLKNVKKFAGELFDKLLVYNTNNEQKKKHCVFVVRSFIQQLFSDLSAAFTYKNDIPGNLKKIIKNFVSDGFQIPFGYLTSFEFNRLEFNTNTTLSHMNNERRAMLVCFIIFYRILILDIFRRHYNYFPTLNLIIENMKRKRLKMEKENYLEKKNMDILRRGIRNDIRIRNNPKAIILKKSEIPPSNPPKKNLNSLSPRKTKTKNLSTSVIQTERLNNINIQTNTNVNEIYGNENNYDDDDDDNDDDDYYGKTNKKKKKNKKKENDDDDYYYEDESEYPNVNKNKKGKKKSKNYDEDSPKKTKKKKSKSKSKKKNKDNNYNDEDDDDYSSFKNGKKSKKNKTKYSEESDDYNNNNYDDNYDDNYYDNYDNNYDDNYDNYYDDNYDDNYDNMYDDNNKLPYRKNRYSNNYDDDIDELTEINSKENDYPYTYDELHEMNTDPRFKLKKKNNYDLEHEDNFYGENLDDDDSNYPKGKKERNLLEKREIEKSRLRVKKLKEEEEGKDGFDLDRKKLKAIITHNFCFIINILHYILKTSMEDNVPRYEEFFKERYLYKLLVFKKTKEMYKIGNDEIELIENIVLDSKKTKNFIEDNKRWLQMYKHVAFQFCNDFAKKCVSN